LPSLPTGTVTFLFTDVEGSTRILRQLGGRYAEVLAQCWQLLRAIAPSSWPGKTFLRVHMDLPAEGRCRIALQPPRDRRT
jgi:hypothetical protein